MQKFLFIVFLFLFNVASFAQLYNGYQKSGNEPQHYEYENQYEVNNWKRDAENAYSKKSYIDAAYFWNKAAEAGDADAQVALGNLYKEGEGVGKNYERAVYWFKKSADQSNIDGLINLGFMYNYGYGVTKNYAKALTYYKEAADLGDATGQYNVGHMYEKGQGVTIDKNEAILWFTKAAEQGDEDAKVSLERLKPKDKNTQTTVQTNEPNYKKLDAQNNSENEETGEIYVETNVGFSPFLAKTISSANFRTEPKTNSSVIKKLGTNTQLYVFSEKDANGFYKAIHIETGKIGWVAKSLVKYTESVEISKSGAFQSTGSSSEYNAQVLIKNSSSSTITLVVGEEQFILLPRSEIKANISPSQTYYIATAPGVIPASGYQLFKSYENYQWEFWITTTRY